MSTEKHTNTGLWIWIVIIVIITAIVSFSIAGALHQNVSTNVSQATQKTDNSAALKDCIAQNVTPQQQAIAGDPYASQASVNAVQVALDACKAQYPTQ